MIEKELQDHLIKRLQKNGLPYIHIPNRAFSKNMKTPNCLKYFPDVQFAYNGNMYMVEFGIMTGGTIRHKERKAKQYQMAHEWVVNGGVYFEVITDFDGLDTFYRVIELY